jgi:ABC-type uncharacterized transport system permease subunit
MSDTILALARGFADAAVPYACVALGGIVSERSGVANVALEASMIVGAFAASAAAVGTESSLAALAAAFAAGTVLGLAHALFAVRLRASSVVVGMALNVGSVGMTRALLRTLYGSSANGPAFSLRFGRVAPLMSAFVLAWLVTIVIDRTRFGVRLRATGENAERAAGARFAPGRVRTLALALGHGLSAIGGATLCVASGQFQAQMSAGRGFLALALVILGRWEVLPTMLGVATLAALQASEVFLQDKLHLPSEAVLALPFVVILPVLALGAGRANVGRTPRFDA